MAASFYIIRDKKSGKYLHNKYHKKATADVNTECRFVSEANAQAVIRDLQSSGADVSNFEVVPVELKLLDPIAANLRKTKSGFYIKMMDVSGNQYGRGMMYWKGNKKDPKMDWSSITRGPKSPETASRFDTREAAELALVACEKTLAEDRKKYQTDRYWTEFERDWKGPTKKRKGQTYIDDIDHTKLEIVEVE